MPDKIVLNRTKPRPAPFARLVSHVEKIAERLVAAEKQIAALEAKQKGDNNA